MSVQDSGGKAATENFSGFDGLIVSPSAKFVRDRAQAEIDTWRTDMPADCLFFDQIGARPWRYDFNPAASEPARLLRRLAEPVRTVRRPLPDGRGRLGPTGRVVLRLRQQPDADGARVRLARPALRADWTTFPLALWLLHDKVLLYQHDLFDGTFTADPEILTWNLAYGYMLSYNWGSGPRRPVARDRDRVPARARAALRGRRADVVHASSRTASRRRASGRTR